MRGFVVKELAHPSKISLSYDVPEPTPGPEEVIVDVYSAALNFFDVSRPYPVTCMTYHKQGSHFKLLLNKPRVDLANSGKVPG